MSGPIGTASFVFLPRDRPHTSRSVGGTARALLIATPGGLENYFHACTPSSPSGADSSQVRAVQAEYGIRPPGPGPAEGHYHGARGYRSWAP